MIDKKDIWEELYIKNLKDADVLAWGDSDAFYRYPKYNYIYDKYLLSKITNTIKVWDLEKEIPNQYPLIIKPKTNLFGLSKDSYVAFSEDEIEDIQGMIAQEFAQGTHYSTDYVLLRGKVIDSFTFIGHKNFYNDFILWESQEFPDIIKSHIESCLNDYTGVANFESINGKIIEGHLRGSLQFYDICGGLLSKLPDLIKTGNYVPVKFEKTYSKVLRTRHNGYVKIKNLPRLISGLRSIQLCHSPNEKLSITDPGSYRRRYCIINGTNLKQIDNFTKMLKGNIFITKT